MIAISCKWNNISIRCSHQQCLSRRSGICLQSAHFILGTLLNESIMFIETVFESKKKFA